MSIRQWTFRHSRHLLCVNCSEIPNSSKGGEMKKILLSLFYFFMFISCLAVVCFGVTDNLAIVVFNVALLVAIFLLICDKISELWCEEDLGE